MEKNVNSPSQSVAPSPKFNVELREYTANSDCGEVVLVRRDNVDFSIVSAFLAVMASDQYVAISYHDEKV